MSRCVSRKGQVLRYLAVFVYLLSTFERTSSNFFPATFTPSQTGERSSLDSTRAFQNQTNSIPTGAP